MSKLYLLIFACCFTFALGAQHLPDNFCANQQGRSAWLKDYQQKPSDFRKGGDTTIYVPMTIHIVGSDSGTGYYSINTFLDAFCTLNESFDQAGIQFFMAGEILYHNNSDYYQHETVLEGAEMMFELNVPNTLNTYFVNDPAGNCGYNLPYAGIANAISCSSGSDITWSHEVGHGLSLPHPFLGWEGGISYDGSQDHSFSDPAPDQVTYDYTFFQDTLILDTLIIDTTYVERMDGSNCQIAADGFCDTAPDYLASRWTCNGSGISSTIQRDPDDVSFQSDGSLIMNYADDACQTRFSVEQRAAMRAFLYDQRPYWISEEPALLPIDDLTQLNSPLDGETVNNTNVTLSWEAVEQATAYVLQISRLSSFPPALTESYLSESNSFTNDELQDNRTYYWRVRAFNPYFSCTAMSANRSFLTDFAVATDEITAVDDWLIYPQPLAEGQSLKVSWQLNEHWNGQLELTNQLGQQLFAQNLQLPAGNAQLDLPTAQLASGVYYLRMNDGKQQQIKKIVVQ